MAKQEEVLTNNPDKVWVNVERTVNLGNYENIKISAGEARTVGPDDKPTELRDKIANKILDEVDDFADSYK
jgi:hypothetical protein